MIEWINCNASNIFSAVLTAGLIGGLGYIIKMLVQYSLQMKALKNGMTWILHDRLVQSCKFYLKKGHISVDDLENLKGLYDSYHDLGGNGTVTILYNRVKALEIKDDDD